MDRITTPFGFTSTTTDVTAGVDLTGRRVVVTGGASGIGIETVRAFAALGAEVTLAVRDTGAGQDVADAITRTTGNDRLAVAHLDLADRGTIHDFTASWAGPLDVLVNNAGVMALPELRRTADGWEMQLATNHLGHFELALGLHAALAAAGAARVVSVSSSGHLFSPVLFDDPHFDFTPYDPVVAYGQSKTASTLFAVGATRRWAADGITANAVMPGAIATNLQRHTGGLRTPVERRKTPEQGASTTLLAATSPLLEGVGGRYLEDNNEAAVVTRRGPDLTGVAPYALDAGNADRLWELSLALLG
ncbi:SDR family NAD(P)-dependent oxidoreductase [Nocardioides sp. 503]|uniref:SDR family NAD(P)-dependent oxidoreductase n=1 Tax=Nocardioides sp. 503 TaxID=2508326 RepID=UPI00106F5C56|nr:SDR family NAD(P)-dependent oxidoreductase [Nocardioides sp. 503]